MRQRTNDAEEGRAHGHLGSISRAASDKDDGPIAPRAHARKDGVGDIYGTNEVRVHVIHNPFGAKNPSVNISLPTRRGVIYKYVPKFLAGAVCEPSRIVDNDIDATPYSQSIIYALFDLSHW